MKAFLEKFKNKAVLWQSLALLGSLAILAVSLMVVLNEKIVVTSPNALGTAVLPDAEFHISVGGKTTAEALRERITVTPTLAYDLIEGDGFFILQPFHTLEAGTKLDITVASAKGAEPKVFAFTVQNVLQVRSFFPADNGKRVNTSTGIELEFNANNITIESLTKAVSVEPAINGEFNYSDGRFVFYPLEPLLPDTKYTVTVAQPLESETGAQLISSVQFSFVTESEKEAWAQSVFQLGGDNISMNVLSTEAPIVQIYLDEKSIPPEQEIGVDIYAFNSAADYRDALSKNLVNPRYKYGAAVDVDTSSLSFRSAFQAVPVPMASSEDAGYLYEGRKLVLFPDTLEEGWYAVELTVELNENKASQIVFIQVSDISMFYMVSDNNMLTWVNDAKTGKAIEGAKVEFTGAYRATGTTLADGTATITNGVYVEEIESRAVGSMFTVTAGERTFVDGNYFYNYQTGGKEAHKYMPYLFTDRPIYHSTDTIQVWGTVRPRSTDTAPLTTVTISLEDGAAVTEAQVAPDGTFTAKLEIENLAMNYWSNLQLKTGDTVLKSTNLRIEDFVKPTYVANTSADKAVYAAYDDESAQIKMGVSTFDGTPASSLELEQLETTELILDEKNLITDANGEANLTAQFSSNNHNTWRPIAYDYSFGNKMAEGESFHIYGNVYAIHRNVMIGTDVKQNANDIDIAVSTNKVSLARIKTENDLWKKDATKGAPIARELTAELHKVYYEKHSTGKYYDFINKVTAEAYGYTRKDVIVKTLNTKTAADGTAVIRDLPKSDRDNCYYIVIQAEDQNTEPIEQYVYLGIDYGRDYYNSGNNRYLLDKQPALSDADLNEQYDDTYNGGLTESRGEFKDNEDVSFLLEKNDSPVTDFTGRILYTVVQDGYSGTTVTDKAQLTLPFDERYVPNYLITGAYFDGKHIFALEDKYMMFNPEARELEVTLTPNKKSYSPAETMEVTASVKDKASGQAAADASVVLSVVDEAIFALSEQSLDILSSLYNAIYSPSPKKYTSYLQMQYGGGGEKGGGGGGDTVRVDFKDTAFFGTARTDAAGTARFSVKLPDNITDWRLSTLALNANGRAGNTKTNVKATKAFFVMPIVPEVALDGDTVTIGLRSAGTGVKDTDEVKYTVTINGDGVRKSEEIFSTVKDYDFVSFEELAQGEYTVTIAGACGTKTDSIRLPFSVRESGIEVSLVKSFNLKDGIDVTPLRYPVNIAVYEKDYRFYSKVLSDIYGVGARTDMRIGRKYAVQMFEKQGATWHDEAALQDTISDVKKDIGAYSLFPYSEPDIELTVKAYLAAPELLNKEQLGHIETNNSGWLKGAKSAYHLAAAISGEPIPQGLKGTMPTLSYIDKMYIATALAVSGDAAGAEECYNTYVKANLSERTAVSGEKAYFIKLPSDAASVNDCTAAASMLASVLHKPEAEGLVRYLIENPSQYEPYLLEKMIYLTNFAKPNNGSIKISYTMDGREITEEIKDVKYFSLTKKQLEEAKFKVISGDAYASIFYTGAPKQVASNDKKLIGVTKTLEPVGGVFKVGALVKVTITPDFSKLDRTMEQSSIIIDDYIPTGMRYESYEGRRGESGNYSWYMRSRQGQRVQFAAWEVDRDSQIVYYARCVAQGDYIVESAYINSDSDSTWGASPRAKVTIQ